MGLRALPSAAGGNLSCSPSSPKRKTLCNQAPQKLLGEENRVFVLAAHFGVKLDDPGVILDATDFEESTQQQLC